MLNKNNRRRNKLFLLFLLPAAALLPALFIGLWNRPSGDNSPRVSSVSMDRTPDFAIPAQREPRSPEPAVSGQEPPLPARKPSGDSGTASSVSRAAGGLPETALVLSSSSGRRTVLKFRMPAYRLTEENRPGIGKAVRIHCGAGARMSVRRGFPELPVFSAELALVPRQDYRIRLENPVWEEIPCLPPVPGDGMLKRGEVFRPADPDPAVYGGTAPYPENICRLVRTGGIRGVDSARAVLMPMQYLPDRKMLRICRSTGIVLEAGGLPETAPLPPLDPNHDFAMIQRRNFMNGGMLPVLRTAAGQPADGVPGEDPGLLILVFPSGWREALSQFIGWKKDLGFAVREAVYGSPELQNVRQLKQWLADQTGATHVILCGDGSHIPPAQRAYSGEVVFYDQLLSDVPYSLFGGTNDIYPDFFLSRITASTPGQLKGILTKLQKGEEALPVPGDDGAWRSRGGFMGSDEGYGGLPKDREVMETERQKLIAAEVFSSGSYALYDEGTRMVTSAQLQQVFQAGVPYFSYLGHGNIEFFETSGFSTADAGLLTNEFRLPLIVSPVCDNGMFINKLGKICLAQAFLANPRGGALGFLGSSDATYWQPPVYLIQEMTRLLIENSSPDRPRLRSLGAWNYQAVQGGVRYCMEEEDRNSARYFLYQMHFFGDSSQIPRALPLKKIRTEFRILADAVEGTALTSAGTACRDALVILRLADGSVLQARTDNGGKFSMDCPSAGGKFAGLEVLGGLLETWQSRPCQLRVRYGSGSGCFWSGQQLQIRAETPAPGRKFLYWRSSLPGYLSLEQRAVPECVFVMPAEDLELTAVMGASGQ